MSRHQLKTLAEDFRATKFNVVISEQKCCNNRLIDQTYRGNVAISTSDQHVNVTTSMSDQHVNVVSSDQRSLDSEISSMLRHRINVVTSVKTLVEDCRTTRYDVATSQQCYDINLR